MILPTAGDFEAFKRRCLAKLGLSTDAPSRITLLLDSNKADIDVDTAPEVEELDEISPEDYLIVVPPADACRVTTDTANASGEQDVEEDAESEGEESVIDADEAEEEGEEEEEPLSRNRPRRASAATTAARIRAQDAEDDDDDDDDEYEAGHGATTRVEASGKRAARRPASGSKSQRVGPKPVIEALLDEDLAPAGVDHGASASTLGSGGGAGDDDELSKVKARIRKMLKLGLHSETGETEAGASMRMAEKLLAKHNLQQADVLDDDHVPEALKGGSTVVHLRSTSREHKPCQTKQWMHTLGNAVTRNFDCSYYFTAHAAPPICDFTFYGIATNASLAAFAFAAAFNRIAILTAAHQVPTGEYEARRLQGVLPPTCTKGAYTAAARVSYMEGLAQGLHEAVRVAKARRELEQQRRLQMAREQASRGEAWQCSDDDDDDFGDYGGLCGGEAAVSAVRGAGVDALDGSSGLSDGATAKLEDEVKVKVVEEEPTAEGTAEGVEGAAQDGVKTEMSAADAVVKLEREAKAATALVTHHENIAKDVLEHAGVKLSHRKRTYTKSVQRRESFHKGKVDSQDIDINQRSLAGPRGGRDAMAKR